ncbi:S-adenosyl-L-methionine-dependent methyltransferase [Crepidotus variabilis]|uniref:tRNA (cytosine(38)-C(5))-methyltransferase n=1 Tax=Crepidotus variabilis TaxID=179855 RepID=A0A9P6EIM8_9AGAR|nr:S-adenosyl-L-methionine-dependent methyltransferase [Crepidotus variabilis]
MPIRALEFYSGIGGLHLALSRTELDAQVIQAFDWDQTACQVYSANHGGIVNKVDISTLTATQLAGYKADLWLLSPACQPYTVLNPNAKGAMDPRAQSFLHLIQNVLPELALSDDHPQRLLVENVAGFEACIAFSSTRQILVSALQSTGYETLELLLTPLQFSIPNSRLRYYMLAKRKPLSFHAVQGDSSRLWRQIPGVGIPWTDPRLDEESYSTHSTLAIKEFLDTSEHTGGCFIPEKVLLKWGRLFDIVKPTSRRTCCFTRGYTQLVERSGSILQKAEILDTTKIFDDFLAAQARADEDPVKILRPLGLRYFSPEELLRLFSFDSLSPSSGPSFTWPPNISTKSKYKLIGNSVNVKVVESLIRYLFVD